MESVGSVATHSDWPESVKIKYYFLSIFIHISCVITTESDLEN